VQDRWADDRLESPEAAMRRARLRAEARLVWSGGRGVDGLAAALGLPSRAFVAMMRGPWFGAAWAEIEAAAPALRRAPIAMVDLADGVRRAERLLSALKTGMTDEPRHAAEQAEVAAWTR